MLKVRLLFHNAIADLTVKPFWELSKGIKELLKWSSVLPVLKGVSLTSWPICCQLPTTGTIDMPETERSGWARSAQVASRTENSEFHMHTPL